MDEVDEPSQELQVHTFDCAKQTVHDVNVNPDLPVEQRKQLVALLEEFSCIFSDIPGRTSVAEHKI